MGWLLRLGEFSSSLTGFVWLGVMRVLTGLCACSILCSDYAIRRINEPFIKPGEDLEEWAL